MSYTSGVDASGRVLVGSSTSDGTSQLVLWDIDLSAVPPPPGSSGFIDIAGSVFVADIEWLAATGITKGCNPPANTLFCPNNPVTRGQMAAFLHRALPGLPLVRAAVDFTDDDGSVFESDIKWLYSRGVTQGTSPTTYGPDNPVTRGQMAAFLHRALGN
ncbi:MAG: S-layer homology domain-containing protein [Acidimicrobiia bacterium]|nr:S-layer homology domain-containing protein [Acidimicrobiia bacterium]